MDGIYIGASMAGIWVTTGECTWALNDSAGKALASYTVDPGGVGLVELRAGDFFRSTCNSFTKFNATYDDSAPFGWNLLSAMKDGIWQVEYPNDCAYYFGTNQDLRSPGTSFGGVQFIPNPMDLPSSGVVITAVECGRWIRVG